MVVGEREEVVWNGTEELFSSDGRKEGRELKSGME